MGRVLYSVFGLSAAVAIAACGGNAVEGVPGPGPAAAVDGGPPPGPRARPPTLPRIQSAGGPVLTPAGLVPIVFPNDPDADRLSAFVSALGQSATYGPSLREYGVGSLTALNPLEVSVGAEGLVDDSDLRYLLGNAAAAVSAGSLSLSNVVFVFFVPASAQVVAPLGHGGAPQSLCGAFAAYHSYLIAADGTPLVYAVVPRCEGLAGLQGPDESTFAASHEIAEALTDPFGRDLAGADGASDQPAFNQMSDPSWGMVFGGQEIGDACAFAEAAFRDADGSLEQHLWSNAAAASGGDPCGQPVYLAAVPELSSIAVPLDRQRVQSMPGLLLAPGASATVPVDLYASDPSAGAFNVEAIQAPNPDGTTPLALAFDRQAGRSGDRLQLRVTVQPPGLGGGACAREQFAISATDGVHRSYWPVVVDSE